jgi:hypothetical protein
VQYFVGYHNADGMGYPASARDPLSIHSKKPVEHLRDGVVWVVEGRGNTPKQFTLAAVFVVDATDASNHEGFSHTARGKGRVFHSPPSLNDLDWFPDFLKKIGHFGIGIQPLTDGRFIDGFIRLAITAG